MSAQVQIGRIAFRHEGDSWNAYYALPGTMDGALLLGSIHIGAVADNSIRRSAFVEMMRGIVSDIIQGKTGVSPAWGSEQTAPEHERSGHG